jgi:hypothetical protein
MGDRSARNTAGLGEPELGQSKKISPEGQPGIQWQNNKGEADNS